MGTFDNVKVGDKVLLIHRHMGGRYQTAKVDVVTKVNKVSFSIKNYSHSFYKADGKMYGDRYSSVIVEPYNEEKYQKLVAQKLEREKRVSLLNAIAKTDFNILSTEKLEKIAELVGI